MVQVALALLQGCGVAEGALVVGNGPLWGAHHSQVVVAVGVNRTEQSVLGGETLVCNYTDFSKSEERLPLNKSCLFWTTCLEADCISFLFIISIIIIIYKTTYLINTLTSNHFLGAISLS